MKVQVRQIGVLILAAYFCPATAGAGAWMQKAGSGIAISNAVYYHADSYFSLDGKRKPQGDYSKLEWNPYIEYGVSDRVTLGLNTAFQYIDADDLSSGISRSNSGIGDTEIFIRTLLWQEGGAVVSIQPLIKLPAYYVRDGLPRSGSEHMDAELRVLGGYGFGFADHNHYVSGEVAYRTRFGAPRDQIRFDVAAGSEIAPKLQIVGQAFSTWRVNTPGMTSFTQSGEDDYSQIKLQLSAVYELAKGYSVQAGGFTDIWGRNSGRGSGVLLSVWKAF